MIRSLSIACLIAGLAALCPASAQAQFNPFEALFGAPPRPPSGVPNGRQPQYQNDQYYQDQRDPGRSPYPGQQEQYRGQDQYRDQQPYPPQANVPTGQPPGIRSQPLPPPPAGTAAIEPGGPSPLPGLPPGQRQPRGVPQPADTAPQPGDEVVTEPPSQKVVNKGALFSGLDKITGRIINFDVTIGETVQFGALQVTPRACYTRPPTETPNTDAFVEVDEVTLQGQVKRIFTGWMFAASPGLHGVEHPIYDVWLSDCKSPPVAAAAVAQDTTATTQVTQPDKPPPMPRRRPAQRQSSRP
jgi:hypothetical protein